MIKKILGAVIILLASLSSLAQAPISVPSQMEFAGIKLKITESAKKEIEKTMDLLTRSQYHFQLKADRSNLYMHFVEKVLREEGIPEDFKYLAIQEGEFISDAVSTSNAVGFWQFKKASAQELGLRVDAQVDERKHIIVSTVGATKYLKRSNFVFDNWVLSLQSYLQGLTGTQRSVPEKWYGAKSMTISAKSHWYILKFIAHKLAFQDFVGDGRKHPEVALSDYSVKGKSLRQVSQELRVDFEELKRFNKWLAQSKIPSEKDYQVIYPVKADGRIVRNDSPKKKEKSETSSKDTGRNSSKTSQNTSNKPNNSGSNKSTGNKRTVSKRPVADNVGAYPLMTGNRKMEYEPGQIKLNRIPAIRAKADENVNDLSRRTGVSVLKLKLFNDIGVKGDVRPGQYYYLKRKKGSGKVHYHVVQPEETLWAISQKYGMRLKKLLSKNRMREVEDLKVGRVLWLRFIRPAKVPVEYSNVLVPKSEIIAENRLIRERDPPKASEKIKRAELPKPEDEIEESPEEKPIKRKELVASATETIITHKVKPKESFFGISRKYGIEIDDILEWNALNIMDGLSIDQELELVVPKTSLIEAARSTGKSTTHEVQKGDTLWGISRKYGVTVEQILQWNNKKENSLSLGEKLKILKDR